MWPCGQLALSLGGVSPCRRVAVWPCGAVCGLARARTPPPLPQVTEEGTEAAAASAVVMQRKAMPRPPLPFRCDRPFALLVRHRTTGAVVFAGVVVRP